VLASGETIRWQGEAIAKVSGTEDMLKPRVILLADEQLTGPMLEKVQTRLDAWMENHIATYLKPLLDIRDSAELTGIARGVAFRLVENLGNIERADVAEDIRKLDQDVRAVMRRFGVRFGAHTIFLPALLKPAPSQLLAELWALGQADSDIPGLQEIPQLSASGRTSVPVDETFSAELYRIAGYRVCGKRAVRVDILERLADLIRPLIAWRPGADGAEPPAGAIERGGGFTVTVAMTSLLGCSGEDFAGVLRSLGYRVQRVPKPPEIAETPKTEEPDAVAGGEPAAAGKDDNAAAEAGAVAAGEDAAPDVSEAAKSESGTSEPDRVETPSNAAATSAAPESVAPDRAAQNDGAAQVEPDHQAQDGETGAGPETVSPDAPSDRPDTATPEPADAASPSASDDVKGQNVATFAADAVPAAAPQAGDTVSAADESLSPDAPGQAEEPEFIEVWRPGGGDRRRQNQGRGAGRHGGNNRSDEGARKDGKDGGPRSKSRRSGRSGDGNRPGGSRDGSKDGQRGGHKAKGGANGKGANRGPDKARRPARPDKPLDPDSPFAALAALKADLEKDRK